MSFCFLAQLVNLIFVGIQFQKGVINAIGKVRRAQNRGLVLGERAGNIFLGFVDDSPPLGLCIPRCHIVLTLQGHETWQM